MNLPNKLTISRIVIIPILMFLYLFEPFLYGKLVATLVFILAIITDMLDGHIARKRNLVTNLGKFLDPIADKLLVTAALLLLAIDGKITSPYGIISVFSIFSLVFFWAYNNSAGILSGLAEGIFEITSFVIFFVAVALTIISGFNYVLKNKALLK